jgi:hypothetical protein
METVDKKNLIEALQKGEVVVTFKKIKTEEIRVMPCTLNPEVLKANGIDTTVENQAPESAQIVCWCTDKNAWRSFIADTVISWEVLG